MNTRARVAYRFAAGLAIAAAFLIVWLNVAAGLIEIEDSPVQIVLLPQAITAG